MILQKMKMVSFLKPSRGQLLGLSSVFYAILVPLSLATSDLPVSALNPGLLSTGIRNLGNTCYMNAQLQCAFHIPLIRKLALINNGDSTLEPTLSSDDGLPDAATKIEESAAKIALRELFTEMVVASSQQLPAIFPRTFCLRLGITPTVQQDSQEFWKLLLPALEQESISDLYKGSFEAYITALDGSGRERRKEEIFLDLSLDVGESSTLLDALRKNFGEPELLGVAEGNGWRPDKGADKVDAHKGSTLIAEGLPPILQFHLKRFMYEWQTDSMTKINSRLAFPSVLDLSSLCKSVEKKEGDECVDLTTYDLQSVVIHMGKYGVGHYYSYVRPDVNSDQWYRFNDHVVEKVSENEMFEDAYGGEEDSGAHNKVSGGIPILGAILRRLGFGNEKSHGYGGRTSNAYVLQYVRRSDRSKLYVEG